MRQTFPLSDARCGPLEEGNRVYFFVSASCLPGGGARYTRGWGEHRSMAASDDRRGPSDQLVRAAAGFPFSFLAKNAENLHIFGICIFFHCSLSSRPPTVCVAFSGRVNSLGISHPAVEKEWITPCFIPWVLGTVSFSVTAHGLCMSRVVPPLWDSPGCVEVGPNFNEGLELSFQKGGDLAVFVCPQMQVIFPRQKNG